MIIIRCGDKYHLPPHLFYLFYQVKDYLYYKEHKYSTKNALYVRCIETIAVEKYLCFYFFNNNFDTKTRMSGYFTSSSNKTNDGISDSEYNKFE